MLTLRGVSKTFTSGAAFGFGTRQRVAAIRNVDLALEDGESLGLVGESGSGKTTLAKIIAGFLAPDAGDVLFQGRDLVRMPQRDRAQTVQMVFQDPFASLNPKLPLHTQILESLRHRRVSDPGANARALLSDVGLSADFLRRYPHQLSGGQRQRFAIARALSAAPRVLLADEPVSSLDLSVQAQIINLLNTLRTERGLSLLVISHDLAVIAQLCARVAVMTNGEIVETGPVGQILNAPAHPYTRRLLGAVPKF